MIHLARRKPDSLGIGSPNKTAESSGNENMLDVFCFGTGLSEHNVDTGPNCANSKLKFSYVFLSYGYPQVLAARRFLEDEKFHLSVAVLINPFLYRIWNPRVKFVGWYESPSRSNNAAV